MCVYKAKDVTSALNSVNPATVDPGTVCYLRQHEILCIRCKVMFYDTSVLLTRDLLLLGYLVHCTQINMTMPWCLVAIADCSINQRKAAWHVQSMYW